MTHHTPRAPFIMPPALAEELADRIELAEIDGHALSERGAVFDLLEDIGFGFRPKSLRNPAHRWLVAHGFAEDVTALIEAGEVASTGKKYDFRLAGRFYHTRPRGSAPASHAAKRAAAILGE